MVGGEGLACMLIVAWLVGWGTGRLSRKINAKIRECCIAVRG